MGKMKMTLSMVRKRIENAGFEIFAERRLPDNTGMQIVTTLSHVVNVYDSGSVLIQGSNSEQMKEVLSQQ
jgi:hypothetical protein